MKVTNPLVGKLKQYPLAWIALVIWIVLLAAIFMRGNVFDVLSAEETELSARLRIIEGNAVSSKNLEIQVDAIEEYVDEIKDRLFESDKRAINSDYLYSFDKTYDVDIQNVSPSQSVELSHSKKGPKELNLHSVIVYAVSVSGEFDDIMEYIHGLYHSEAFMRIADLSVQPDASAGTDGLRANIRLLVLAEKESP